MKLNLDQNSATDPTPLAEPLCEGRRFSSRRFANANGTRIELGSNATDRSKLRLRGSKFFYTPRPIVIAKVNRTEWSSVTLIYRGNTYERKLQPPQPYRQPRTLNWRWQTRRVSELESKY